MAKLIGWIARAPGLWGVLSNENKGPQSPWGGGKGGNDGGDAGRGGGSGGGDDAGGGPHNPWAFPPEGKRGGRGSVTSLDDFLKRARKGGGGSGGGFPGGVPGKPVIFGGIAIVLLLWIAFTSFHVIAPEQRGVVAFFGKYSSTLEPGVRFTLPAPIASVKKINVQQIRTENFPATSGENLMLTQDQNIVDLAYSVRWDIANPEDYVFQIAKPEQTVRATAESAMRAAVAGVTLNDAIGPGRTVVEARVQQATQAILDEYNSGIRIQGVSIRGAAAPGAVDEAFKQVTAAQQESEGARNQARAYAQQIIALAQGEAAQFDKIYEQYKAAPDVTRRRLYYETMEAVLAKSNKTIVETNGVTPYLPLPAARGGTTQPSVQQGQQAQQGQPQGGAQ